MRFPRRNYLEFTHFSGSGEAKWSAVLSASWTLPSQLTPTLRKMGSITIPPSFARLKRDQFPRFVLLAASPRCPLLDGERAKRANSKAPSVTQKLRVWAPQAKAGKRGMGIYSWLGGAKRQAKRECTEAKRRGDSAKPNPKGAQASARSQFCKPSELISTGQKGLTLLYMQARRRRERRKQSRRGAGPFRPPSRSPPRNGGSRRTGRRPSP